MSLSSLLLQNARHTVLNHHFMCSYSGTGSIKRAIRFLPCTFEPIITEATVLKASEKKIMPQASHQKLKQWDENFKTKLKELFSQLFFQMVIIFFIIWQAILRLNGIL